MLELFGTQSCRYTAELRDDLEYEGEPFTEYDVETDAAALRRLLDLTNGNRMVPVLVQDGHVKQVGMNGRGCFVGAP